MNVYYIYTHSLIPKKTMWHVIRHIYVSYLQFGSPKHHLLLALRDGLMHGELTILVVAQGGDPHMIKGLQKATCCTAQKSYPLVNKHSY